MKRFLFILFSFILVLSLTAPAFASAGEGESSQESTSTTETVYLVPDVVTDVYLVDTQTENGELTGVNLYYSTNSGVNMYADSSTGLKAVLLSFIGDYEGIVVEYSYQNTNGNTSYVREIHYDYPWLCSAALLVVMIFCLFRLGGAILCKT